MQITQYFGTRIPGGITADLPWAEVAAKLTTPIPQVEKEAGALWSPCSWWEGVQVGSDHRGRPIYRATGTPLATGGKVVSRVDHLVREITAAVVDFDGITRADFARVAAHLEAEGLAAVVHSTWSHGAPGKPNSRLRLVVPFETPVPYASWQAVWGQVVAYLAQGSRSVDTSCKNPARGYYFHTHHPDREPLACVLEGRPLRLSDLPGGVLALPAPSAPLAVQSVSAGMVEALAKRLQSMKGGHQQEVGERMARMIRGEVYARPEEGRHERTKEIVREIVKQWPGIDEGQGAGLFAPALTHPEMRLDLPEVASLFAWWKRQRVEEAQDEQDEQAKALAHECRRAWEQADEDRATAYLPDEVTDLAKRHMTPESFARHGVDGLRDLWVLSDKSKGVYILGPGGYEYHGESQGQGGAKYLLAPAVTAGVDLHRTTEAGKRVAKTIAELRAEYGSPVHKVSYRYQLPGTKSVDVFDSRTKSLVKGTAPFADVAPGYDAEIDQWLRLMLTPTQYDDVCAWLSHLPDLDQPLAALLMVGAKGAGKSLICDGVASLWAAKGVDAAAVVGRYAEGLLHSPCIVAEEELPKNGERGVGTSTTWLRRIVSRPDHDIEAKYRDVVKLEGCLRFVANLQGMHQVKFDSKQESEDLKAMRERLLIVEIGQEAAEAAGAYLESLGGRAYLLNWTGGQRRFAAHVWALRAHRLATGAWKYRGRFGVVQATTGEQERELAARGNIQQDTIEAVGSELAKASPQTWPGQDFAGVSVRVVQGEVLVNTQALRDRWCDALKRKSDAPTATAIGRALGTLATRKDQRREHNRRWHVLDGAMLAKWAEAVGIADDGPAWLASKEEKVST